MSKQWLPVFYFVLANDTHVKYSFECWKRPAKAPKALILLLNFSCSFSALDLNFFTDQLLKTNRCGKRKSSDDKNQTAAGIKKAKLLAATELKAAKNPKRLFKPDPKSLIRPEIWETTMLISLDNSKSDWKTSDAVYAHCTKCDTVFDYHYRNNSKGVSSHYYKCREYNSKKQAAVETAAIEAAAAPPPATIRTKLPIGNPAAATATEKGIICCSNKDCKEWPYTNKVNSPDRAQCVLCNGWMHSKQNFG
jgi:hypothetical protein